MVRLAYRFDCIISVFSKDASNPSDEDKTDVIIQSIYKNRINYFHLIRVTRTRKMGKRENDNLLMVYDTTLRQINRANLVFVVRPH